MLPKYTKRIVAGLAGTGLSLWVWSRNRERTLLFYSPEQFEEYAVTQLRSWDPENAQPQWLARLDYNWFSDVPLVVESISEHQRRDKRLQIDVEPGWLVTSITATEQEVPVMELHHRTIYKCVTRMSREEFALTKPDPSDPGEPLALWSRDHHDAHSFGEFMRAYEQQAPEKRKPVSDLYPGLAQRVRDRCVDDRHVKIRFVYRERLSPRFLLTLCGLE